MRMSSGSSRPSRSQPQMNDMFPLCLSGLAAPCDARRAAIGVRVSHGKVTHRGRVIVVVELSVSALRTSRSGEFTTATLTCAEAAAVGQTEAA
jgi:hypothetical protein